MRVLITGAAGGIGSATAESFEAAGHTVVRHDVRDGTGIDLAGDLLDPVHLERVRILSADRRIDTVVAAHGLAGPGALPAATPEFIHRTMRVNSVSVVMLYEALAPDLIPRDGAFIGVSSQAGLHAEAQNAVYSASKFAVVGWAQGVAAGGVSPRMRVVCPGMTETPLLTDGLKGMAAAEGLDYHDFLRQRLGTLPLGRLGRPSEIARATLWLAELTTTRCVVAAITGGSAFE